MLLLVPPLPRIIVFFFLLTLEYELHLLPAPSPSLSHCRARPPYLGPPTETRCFDFIMKVESGLCIPMMGKSARSRGWAGQRGRIQEIVVGSGAWCLIVTSLCGHCLQPPVTKRVNTRRPDHSVSSFCPQTKPHYTT